MIRGAAGPPCSTPESNVTPCVNFPGISFSVPRKRGDPSHAVPEHCAGLTTHRTPAARGELAVCVWVSLLRHEARTCPSRPRLQVLGDLWGSRSSAWPWELTARHLGWRGLTRLCSSPQPSTVSCRPVRGADKVSVREGAPAGPDLPSPKGAFHPHHPCVYFQVWVFK